jgi:hypothetical protein
MVNNMGQWFPEPDYAVYPKENWCDMDYVMDLMRRVGYEPKHDVEQLVQYVIDNFTNNPYFTPKYNRDNHMINTGMLNKYVEMCGGFKEFDIDI